MANTSNDTSAVTLDTLRAMKKAGEPIACLTAYDASFAQLIDQSMVDIILVGDSLGMVIQGDDSTVGVSVNDVIYHSKCVSRVVHRAFLIADMPFMSCTSIGQALYNAQRLIQEGGCKMVKVETDEKSLAVIRTLAECAIPVCAHIGLLPQQAYKRGSLKGQAGRLASEQLLDHAESCVEAGADLLLAECIAPEVAQKITRTFAVPFIGIGSGIHCDGQILVMHDVIGASKQKPKFASDFLSSAASLQEAFHNYVRAVKDRRFPSDDLTL